jgi:hypothetical protein
MGQYWKILDIDRREELPNKNGLKLWEIVNSDTAQQLVHLLARPTFLQCNEILYQESAGAARPATEGSGVSSNIGRLTKLPNELFIILTGFLTDSDAIILGLTCRALWLNMQARVQEALIADAARWSGHRIITLGDYADALPPNMLTEAEETELRHFSFGAEAETKLLHMAVECLLDPTDARLLRTLTGSLYNFADDEDGYVLRNLSQHEYVRGNALVELCGIKAKLQQPFIQPVGFGELLAMNTQWTDDPSGTIGPMKGRWAGDRFDIVLMKTLEREGTGGTWRDISEDAVNMLEERMGDKLRGV